MLLLWLLACLVQTMLSIYIGGLKMVSQQGLLGGVLVRPGLQKHQLVGDPPCTLMCRAVSLMSDPHICDKICIALAFASGYLLPSSNSSHKVVMNLVTELRK